MSILPAQRAPIAVYTDAPGILYDSIVAANQVQTWGAGTTIVLNVRPIASRMPVLSPAATVITPPDQYGNNVSYAWQPSDIVALGEGDFMAWWTFTLPAGAGTYDTPEFPLVVTDHGPGFGTQTGLVVDGVAAFMPVTLDVLRNDTRYGDRWLQQQANVIEMRTLGYTIDPNQESGLNVVLLDYLSKRLALGLTKPGKEYWSRQWKTVSTQQTQEMASYPDMIATLDNLKHELIHELRQEWKDLLLIVPGLPQRTVVSLPQSSIGAEGDPHHWKPNTKTPREMPPLLTGGAGWGLYWGVFPFP